MTMQVRLPEERIARARELAAAIAAPVQRHISAHTTTTVERATLRWLGADGVDGAGVPVPNLVVDQLRDRLAGGAARPYVSALLATGKSVEELNAAIAGGLDLGRLDLADAGEIRARGDQLAAAAAARMDRNVALRNARLEAYRGNARSPLLYVIVATGNIYEDVKQAQAAAQQGADAVAVIRSTAQSLLDFVPYGPTTEGFGGTYATQANFRIMRQALDEVSDRQKRYVRLVNYCSGLCMPEIAVMGAFERLDMMLNDSMYGVLFRDINMYRTFVDQHFSRMINAYADVIINTGEDNYLTTADAVEKAHTVLASQFLNERFAWSAGLPSRLQGLGHAFEIDPALEHSALYEFAQALMARQIFPECPLKYMPPTKHMTGDVYRTYLVNGLFNLVSKATGQDIHLLGMLTEGIHTPHIQDRDLAVRNAAYVMNAMAGFGDEFEVVPDGLIARRANQVLAAAVALLEEVAQAGLFASIASGAFADVKRDPGGGRGLAGVVPKAGDYWNPVESLLRQALGVGDATRPVAGRPAPAIGADEIKAELKARESPAEAAAAIRPYGDTLDDGAIQLTFTLPMADSPRARAAARALMAKHGFRDAEIVHAAAMGAGFTMFIVCARTDATVAPAELVVPDEAVKTVMGLDEVNAFIRERIGRRIVVVGACTGSDAHTVGIDAIMNMKGYNHHFGLEAYPMIDAHNLGAQVANERLVAYARDVKADAILVSQLVTEKGTHRTNLAEFVKRLEAEGLRDRVIAIVGGPRITPELARELGFDAAFGKGTYAEHVATFIVRRLAQRLQG